MPEKFECMTSLYLPECLVIDIILRLPVKSVARFRCVSTVWLSISTDPSFIAHTLRTPKSLVFPFVPLNLLHRNELFPVSIGFEGLRHITDIPLSSCDGLVCFRGFQSRGACEYYVLNPVTGLRIDFPSPSANRNGENSWGCELYYHRWTGQYRLLNVRHGQPLDAEVLSLGGAMNSWRQINVTAHLGDLWVLWDKCVRVNDFLYWITNEFYNTILVFDILEEAFSCIDCPPDVVRRRTNMGLVGIEGKLGCWMASSHKYTIDNYVIFIWVAVEGGGEWRSTYYLYLADELCRLIYPSPYALIPFVFFSKGEILFLVHASDILYLLRWDLKSGNHSTQQLYNQPNMSFDRTLIHRETLIDMATITHYA